MKNMSMTKVEAKLRKLPAVNHVDSDGDTGIIVTLHKPWEFESDPGCGVRGFDSMSEAYRETKQSAILTIDRQFANRSRDLMRTAVNAADEAQQYASKVEDKKLRAELEAEIVNLF